MLHRLRQTIQQHDLIRGGAPVLAAVSGGADSLALLHLLHELGVPLICAHFDHQLRPGSEQEADLVRGAARSLGVGFVPGAGDVAAYRRAHGLSPEEAARHLRYRFLFETARRHGAQAVAAGHTADDQAETVLLHLLRGAGLAGLKGMSPRTILPAFDAQMPLIRPLLAIWRAETEAFCRERGLQPVDDPSNRDTTLFRNRLRHAVIPLLERHSPRLRANLLKTARTLAADETVLQGVTEAAWGTVLREAGDGFVGLGRRAFLAQPEGVQARLVRRAAAQLLPDLRDLDFAAVQRALDLARGGRAFGECDLAGGLKLFAEGDALWLAKSPAALPLHLPQVSPGSELTLECPGRLALANGWRLSLEESNMPEEDHDPFRARVDLDKLPPPVKVRSRRPGDRFRPLGMAGSLKLSDFLINEKVPARARAGLPLVVCGDGVVWVAGVRVGERFRVTGETRRAGVLSVRRG